MKRNLIALGITVTLALLGSSSFYLCSPSTKKKTEAQQVLYQESPRVVLKVWKAFPMSVHQEVSPSFRAAISGGDTIVVSPCVEVGDTIIIMSKVSN